MTPSFFASSITYRTHGDRNGLFEDKRVTERTSGGKKANIRFKYQLSVIYEEIYIHACNKDQKPKSSGFHRKDVNWAR